jgi:hypothetical protein
MKIDIIDRLRELGDIFAAQHAHPNLVRYVLAGADEIERLRAENAKLRAALEWAAVQLGNNNLPAFAHQVRAALGGDT